MEEPEIVGGRRMCDVEKDMLVVVHTDCGFVEHCSAACVTELSNGNENGVHFAEDVGGFSFVGGMRLSSAPRMM